MSSTLNERWVSPGSVNDRSRCGSLPARSKWSSSRMKPSRSRYTAVIPTGSATRSSFEAGASGTAQVALVGEPEQLLVEATRDGEVGDAVADVVEDRHWTGPY